MLRALLTLPRACSYALLAEACCYTWCPRMYLYARRDFELPPLLPEAIATFLLAITAPCDSYPLYLVVSKPDTKRSIMKRTQHYIEWAQDSFFLLLTHK